NGSAPTTNGSRPIVTIGTNGRTPSTADDPPPVDPSVDPSPALAEPVVTEPQTVQTEGNGQAGSGGIYDYGWAGEQLVRRSELLAATPEENPTQDDEKGAETDASESAPPRER